MARADLSLPATNDGWFDAAEPGFLGRHAASYELACALWQDPAHAALLARVYAGGTPRDAVEALLYGPDALPSSSFRLPAGCSIRPVATPCFGTGEAERAGTTEPASVSA